jgi:hypothetical protein
VTVWPQARREPDLRVVAVVAELDQLIAELSDGRPDPAAWISHVKRWRAGIVEAGTVDRLDEIRLNVARKVAEAVAAD